MLGVASGWFCSTQAHPEIDTQNQQGAEGEQAEVEGNPLWRV